MKGVRGGGVGMEGNKSGPLPVDKESSSTVLMALNKTLAASSSPPFSSFTYFRQVTRGRVVDC